MVFKSVLKKIFSSARKSKISPSRFLKLETLEDRTLLSAVPASWSLASVEGTIGETLSPTMVLDLNAVPDQEVLIGIDVAANEGSSLQPGKLTIYRYDSSTGIETDITDEVTYLSFQEEFVQESLLYAKLSSGEYHITLTPDNETAGGFTASVFLLGDTDGSGHVDDAESAMLGARISAIQIHNRGVYSQPTVRLYQSRYGIDITQPVNTLYSSLYDFNLDGLLNSEDIFFVDFNKGETVTADLSIQTAPTPKISPVPYTIAETLDSDNFTPVSLDVPSAIVIQCEESTVESFTVKDETSMSPSLLLTAEDGTVYATEPALLEYWGITESEFAMLTSRLAGAASLSSNIWTFQNESGLFDFLDEGDTLSLTFTYTVNSFTYDGSVYKSSTPGTITLNVLGKGNPHVNPEGPTSHTAAFNVGTGELIFDETSPTLNVLDGVTDPLGYEMTASLISVTSSDPSYTISDGAIQISPQGEVVIIPEILAEDFEDLQRDAVVAVDIAYTITDTHSGSLNGSIAMAVTGGNHAPTGVTSHTASILLASGTVLFDGGLTSLNLLDKISDPDGDALTAEKTGLIQPEGYTVSPEAVVISDDGAVTISPDILRSDFANLSGDDTAVFTVDFAVYDTLGASLDGEITFMVAQGSYGPQGVSNHTASVDLTDSSLIYDDNKSSLNLLDGVTDAQGLELSVQITEIDSGTYSLPVGAVTQTDGQVSINVDDFQEVFKDLALDEKSQVLVTFAVTNSNEDSVLGSLTITVIGRNQTPYETDALTGIFNLETGVVEFNTGDANPDILYGMVDPEAEPMSGQILTIEPPTGYSISDGAFQLSETSEGKQCLIIDTELLAGDFDLLPRGQSADIKINIQITDPHGAAVTRTATMTVLGAYEPVSEDNVTVSLIATVERTSGNELKTGTANFGTFYYLPAEDVPQTNYESVALSDEYYLEIWVNDNSYSVSHEQKFVSSLQVQLNYELDQTVVKSIELDDIYAGKYALDEYLYYDDAQQYFKALQLAWMFSDDLDWSKIDPITNGENAYLLARFKVTLSEPFTSGFSTSVSGVTEPESPFVDGWYYVRTGESDAVDSSKFITVNVDF